MASSWYLLAAQISYNHTETIVIIMDHNDDLKVGPVELAVGFSGSYLPNSKLVNIVDRVQEGGRWVPVFGPVSKEKEDAYIEKWLNYERSLNNKSNI